MKHKEEVRPTEVTRDIRPDRVPIHGGKNKLTVEGQEAGFHYCWVNDYNVPRYERAGYEFVTHAVIVGDRRIESSTGIGSKISLPGGNNVVIYLMRIPQELFNQDMASFNEKIDDMEATMFEAEANVAGRYGKVGREKLSRG